MPAAISASRHFCLKQGAHRIVHAGENSIWRRCLLNRNPQRTISTPPVAVKQAPSQLKFSHPQVKKTVNSEQ